MLNRDAGVDKFLSSRSRPTIFPNDDKVALHKTNLHSCLTKYKNKQETPTWLASALNFSFPTTIPAKLIHSMEAA